ncbi:MAG: hypothetical protein EOO88_29075 [Pedobacter sp.]|nr:MAG: hypothetical protein EOO88_29075 [Pedobacter sp.]
MAKVHTDKEIEKLQKDLEKEQERSHEAFIALMDAKNQLLWTQTQLIGKLTGTSAGSPAPKTQPPNYDSPDFDDILNKNIEDATITNGIASQVYHGRFVAIQLTGNGSVELRQQSHHLRMNDNKYSPIRLQLSQETFFLILEAMEFAEKKFGLDRKAAIEKLTGGDELNFKDAISLI